MKHIQKLGYTALGAVLALAIVLGTPALAASVQKTLSVYYNDIKIVVDGVKITPKDANGKVIEPFVADGTTYMPVRAVAEALGKPVSWDAATQTAYIGAVPGKTQYMTDILPAYECGNSNYFKEYSAIASGGTKSFNMGGVKYTDGFTFGGYNLWAVWNLNSQYSSLTAAFCHVDGTATEPKEKPNQVIQIFCDGVLRQEIPVRSDMSPIEVTLNLSGVNQLKIAAGSGIRADALGFETYGFGNPVLR